MDFDADATELLVVGDVPRRQVERRKEALAPGTECRIDVRHTVECDHGPFDVWICPQKRLGDDGRRMAESYRVFPEGDPVFLASTGWLATRRRAETHTRRRPTPTSGRSRPSGWPRCSTSITTSSWTTSRPGTSRATSARSTRSSTLRLSNCGVWRPWPVGTGQPSGPRQASTSPRARPAGRTCLFRLRTRRDRPSSLGDRRRGISRCKSPSIGPLAHRVEQGTFNPKVPGSRPGRPTSSHHGTGCRPPCILSRSTPRSATSGPSSSDAR
jgi:hypothetical protein